MASSQCLSCSRLPDDVCCEILLHLPPKSLLRFKSVCKSWLSLIGSSDFVDHHRQKFGGVKDDDDGRLLVMHCRDDGYESDCDGIHMTPTKFALLSPHNDHYCVDLDVHRVALSYAYCHIGASMSCLDGIICFFISLNSIYLWNPATRETRCLPEPKKPVSRGGYYLLRSVAAGFGFDLKTIDYKVVTLRILSTTAALPAESGVQLYSLNTDSWRTLDVAALPVSYIISDIKPPLRNGRISCWFCGIRSPWYSKQLDLHLILWFDFCTEEFGVAQLPDNLRQNPNMQLAVTRDDSITSTNFLENGEFEVWVMKEFCVQESWTKLYQIRPFWDKTGPILSDGESFLVVWNQQLYFHNTVTQETKKLPLKKVLDTVLHSISYKESLVPIKRLNYLPYSRTSKAGPKQVIPQCGPKAGIFIVPLEKEKKRVLKIKLKKEKTNVVLGYRGLQTSAAEHESKRHKPLHFSSDGI